MYMLFLWQQLKSFCHVHVELLKYTPELHPDHDSLVEVVEVVKSTLV